MFIRYAADQRGWLVLNCATNKAAASIHVSFDESDTDAAAELQLIEYAKLTQCTATAFDFYSRRATSTADLLFYGRRLEVEKPSPSDFVLLEEFVSDFDLQSIDALSAATSLACYALESAPRLSTLGPQGATSWQRLQLVLRAPRAQKQAELLVALENVQHKHEPAKIASHKVESAPTSYSEAMRRPDAALWREAADQGGKASRLNKT